MDEKIIETKQCTKCSTNFNITDKDFKFYNKISPILEWEKFLIPTPTLCPDCRQQRRLSFRNERKLYKRKCAKTGENIISIYSPDKPYTVYSQDFWWSDKWKALDYWFDLDFNKWFFEQFWKLIKSVPKSNLPKCWTIWNKNCEYTIWCEECKDSYLLWNSISVEKWFYSRTVTKSDYVVDSIDIKSSNNIYYCDSCNTSNNLFFCSNLKNCNNCILCIWLVWKKYCILNKQYSEEEYNNISEIYKNNFLKYKNDLVSLLRKENNNIGSEKCFWDYCNNSKNCYYCFEINWNEDCKYCFVSQNTKDSYDISYWGYIWNLVYELANSWVNVYKSAFSVYSYWFNSSYYLFDCNNIKNCFWCVWIKNKQYCIFNKQYSKEEYNQLVPKIIEKMTADWEWWEFFPASISPFWYNETVSNEYYPLTKQEALKKWFNWSDYEQPIPKVEKIIPANKLPDNIANIPDDILNWAIECENTKKPFRIIPQELEFYRKHNLPVPRKHPDERHLDRMKLRNPRKLYDRKCDKCWKNIKSTYSPNREEIVYCEECYNKEIY